MSDAMRSYVGKRMFDIVFLAVLAVPAVVIGVVVAVLVKTGSRGPIFFRQVRVGRAGTPFVMMKFRTMVDAPDNPLFPDDDRITHIGRLLRRTSLDELPQLLNVARGDMSIVGPRPTLPYQVERYNPTQRQRLAVRPGITGWAQVKGRNELSWAERIELDLEYVRRQSVLLDLQIVARSIAAVLLQRGTGGHPTDDPIALPPE